MKSAFDSRNLIIGTINQPQIIGNLLLLLYQRRLPIIRSWSENFIKLLLLKTKHKKTPVWIIFSIVRMDSEALKFSVAEIIFSKTDDCYIDSGVSENFFHWQFILLYTKLLTRFSFSWLTSFHELLVCVKLQWNLDAKCFWKCITPPDLNQTLLPEIFNRRTLRLSFHQQYQNLVAFNCTLLVMSRKTNLFERIIAKIDCTLFLATVQIIHPSTYYLKGQRTEHDGNESDISHLSTFRCYYEQMTKVLAFQELFPKIFIRFLVQREEWKNPWYALFIEWKL